VFLLFLVFSGFVVVACLTLLAYKQLQNVHQTKKTKNNLKLTLQQHEASINQSINQSTSVNVLR